MNAAADNRLRERKAEKDAVASAQRRRHFLEHLKLKTVIKESHCTPLSALSFNLVDEECSNVFATVGKDQATIYDDLHMGDYIGVVVQYTNQETEHTQGGDLRACAWLNTENWTEHPHGDACLAVAGSDTDISIISIVEARVIKQLRGHNKEVVELCSCSGRPGLLSSLSKDGNLRLWDVPSDTCLASLQTDATCLALHPDGDLLVTGSRKGAMHCLQVPAQQIVKVKQKKAKSPATTPANDLSRTAVKMDGANTHMESLDCLRFLDSTRLASKSADGRLIISDFQQCSQLLSWKIPSCSASGGLDERCQFGTTPDGAFLCVGNSKGEVHVYETSTGTRLAHQSAIKVSGPVRACGLSEDCRHLLAAMGNGFIFRFEYCRPAEKEASADKDGLGDAMEE